MGYKASSEKTQPQGKGPWCYDLSGDVTLFLQVPIHQVSPGWVSGCGSGSKAPLALGRACQHRAQACIRLQEAGAQAMPEGCEAQSHAR